jgi:phage terminase large subunit-like protein
MADAPSNSWYTALSADVGTHEGMNIHYLIMDEMHAQKGDAFWNALMYGGAARRQPLQVIITTAGVDTGSLCYEYHQKAMQVMEGTLQDDSFFAYVRSAEWAMRRLEDDAAQEACWEDPRVSAEANPSLGETITLAGFREDCLKAVQSPRLQNAFKCYRLNIWTQQEDRWLPLDHWAACGDVLEEDAVRAGVPRRAGSGVDVGSLCAGAVVSGAGASPAAVFWVPEETVQRLEAKGDASYATWVKQGFLQTTEGNVTDYDVIRECIKGLAGRFRLQELAYDRWGATQLITQLQGDGLECVGFGQGFASMSAPSKEFERLI